MFYSYKSYDFVDYLIDKFEFLGTNYTKIIELIPLKIKKQKFTY